MKIDQIQLEETLSKLSPILLPPAEYPPAVIVRDTPQSELLDRIRSNAEKINLTLTNEHYEVINFLFDFYVNCCEFLDPGYTAQKVYWKYVDCTLEEDCVDRLDQSADQRCQYGQLSANEATSAYRIYRILLKAFSEKGGSRHLYELFPYGPLFTIHLLAQLPRLRNDVNAHFGTAY